MYNIFIEVMLIPVNSDFNPFPSRFKKKISYDVCHCFHYDNVIYGSR